MAKKKKPSLPKNFKEMLEAGGISQLKDVFDTCELDARGGYNKGTALHFYDVPEELVRWLAEQGANVNAQDSYGRTPLNHQINIGLIRLLLNLGADIDAPDRYGVTPLHTAAGFFRADTVRFLIERGANINAENTEEETPLAYALSRCRNIDVAGMAEIAVMLLDAGAKVSPDMAESVKRIGEEFEFHRDSFNKDYLAAADAGLTRLCELFCVTPVQRRSMHDGVSPIIAADGTWQEQYAELWDLLVPSQGAAKTVQGEVVRITGRVRDELHRNGGANWDSDYRRMLDDLLKHFASGRPLTAEELAETKALISSIRAKGDGNIIAIDRLCELAVRWVLVNPEPAPLPAPGYKR